VTGPLNILTGGGPAYCFRFNIREAELQPIAAFVYCNRQAVRVSLKLIYESLLTWKAFSTGMVRIPYGASHIVGLCWSDVVNSLEREHRSDVDAKDEIDCV